MQPYCLAPSGGQIYEKKSNYSLLRRAGGGQVVNSSGYRQQKEQERHSYLVGADDCYRKSPQGMTYISVKVNNSNSKIHGNTTFLY